MTTVLVGAMALFVASALGVLTGSPSNFESGDGDMIVGTVGNNDWASVDFLHLPDVFNSTSDDSFAPGQKQDTTCPDVEGHKNPAKDDFTDVARYVDVNDSGHTFLYGATIRYAANGNASENIELKQGTGGLCPGSQDLLQRVAGDRLIAIDYTGGGTSAQFHVLKWVASGACFVSNHTAPCWGATVTTLSSNAAEGEANQAPITAANNPINNKALVTGQFAEFGIDLSAGTDPIIPPGDCTGFAQAIWESRASGSSFVSSTKDIVEDNVGVDNCGEIHVVKQTNPRGLDQDFDFTSTFGVNSGAGGNCSGIASDGSFCLNDDGNTTGNDAQNTVDATGLSPGDYTFAEGADPTGFEFASVSCVDGQGDPASNVAVNGKEVTVDLQANDNITCTYINDQLTGAIEVIKNSVKGASTPLAGAHFSVCTNDGPYDSNNLCTPAATGSGDLVTGSDGKACVDGLALGDYYVTEKTAPDGYARDDTSTSLVPVDNGADCDDAQYGGESTTYTDTPLTDVLVHAESQAEGGTASAISCVDALSAHIGNSPQPATGFDDPVTVTANGLRPGTYTCTIVIDP